MYKISDAIIQNFLRLCEINNRINDEETNCGFVNGIKTEENIIFCNSITKNQDYTCFNSVGVYDTRQLLSDEEYLLSACKTIKKKNGTILVLLKDETCSQIKVKLLDIKKKIFKQCNYEIITNNIYLSNCLNIEITGNFFYEIKFDEDYEIFEKNILNENENQEKKLRKTLFKLKNSDFEMNSSKNDDGIISQLYSFLHDDEMNELNNIQKVAKSIIVKAKNQIIKKWIENKKKLTFVFNSDIEDDDYEVYKVDKDKKSIKIIVPVYLYIRVPSKVTITTFANILSNCLLRILNQIKMEIFYYYKISNNKFIIKPQFFNFLPLEYSSSTFNLFYAKHLSEDELIEKRKLFCNLLNLPIDRPLLRRSNALGNEFDENILKNVHFDLLPTSKGTLSLVKGTYSYYHYLQNNINDNGWGCAYRSLQTIISWFNHQGYIQIHQIPTHHEIQQVLVDLGDKSADFVGSKQWIGSQEIGYVLNHLYGIISKFLFVNSGSNLASKARELIDHFDKQATPIMIGGGSYAYTILGINFNENTGSVKFLVLDPHYVGNDSLKLIQSKGWCGWKESNFWQSNCFYNLCMPQRPELF